MVAEAVDVVADTVDKAGIAADLPCNPGVPGHMGCTQWAWAQKGKACTLGTVDIQGRTPVVVACPVDAAGGMVVELSIHHLCKGRCSVSQAAQTLEQAGDLTPLRDAKGQPESVEQAC